MLGDEQVILAVQVQTVCNHSVLLWQSFQPELWHMVSRWIVLSVLGLLLIAGSLGMGDSLYNTIWLDAKLGISNFLCHNTVNQGIAVHQVHRVSAAQEQCIQFKVSKQVSQNLQNKLRKAASNCIFTTTHGNIWLMYA